MNLCSIVNENRCCFDCDKKDNCEYSCDYQPAECGSATMDNEEEGLQLFQKGQVELLKKIAATVIAKKKLEDQEALMKEELTKSMEKFGIKKFSSDLLNITYVDATTATTIDSAKLKNNYPEIAEKCSKTSSKSAYIKITVKQ